MSRRRLQIICSSSDEEEDDPQQRPIAIDNDENENPSNIDMEILESSTSLQSVTLNSVPPTIHPTPDLQPHVHDGVAADCGIGRVLEGLGLRLRREWLESCVSGLEGSVPEFSRLDDTTKAKLCFEQFLYSDMNYCGAGMLPKDVQKLHLVDIKGPFVLQVDEIVNISCPLRGRYQKAAAGLKRCLKLSMTDGIQHVFGMEYRPIKDLDVLAPSGMKVAIHNVHVRHGLLMLVPEVIEFLGGVVEELEGARQRLVNEINKPPRGKRTRNGEVPPLATRATFAAWPPEGVSTPEHADTTRRESSMPFHVHQQETNSRVATAETEEIHPIYRENVEPGLPSAMTITTPVPMRDAKPNFPSSAAASVSLKMKDTGPSFSSNAARHVENIHMVDMTTEGIDAPIGREHNEPIHLSSSTSTMEVEELLSDVTTGPATPASGRSTESVPVSISRDVMNGPATPASGRSTESIPASISRDVTNGSATSASGRSTESVPASISSDIRNCSATPASGRSKESVSVSISRVHNEDAELESLSTAAMEAEEIDVVDELEHPFILSGEKENPFTYLASLSAKQAQAGMKGSGSTVIGKIKCFLTGVKGFQFKQRNKYELRAYVDDGSLISEILIDHDIVQKEIGFSPAEVTTALDSSDGKLVSDMRVTLKRFQKFLSNFEGTMLVQMNEGSPIPVAIEMNQGCPASDAWLLLKRLKPSASSQPHHLRHPETINLSP